MWNHVRTYHGSEDLADTRHPVQGFKNKIRNNTQKKLIFHFNRGKMKVLSIQFEFELSTLWLAFVDLVIIHRLLFSFSQQLPL